MAKIFLSVFILVLGSWASAATVGVGIYFPGTCPGPVAKATLLSAPTVSENGDSYAVGFHLQYLDCAENAQAFASYEPMQVEYLQVYPSHSGDFASFKLMLVDHAVAASAGDFSFAVPKQALDFHVDVFLYGTRIPYHLVIDPIQKKLAVVPQ